MTAPRPYESERAAMAAMHAAVPPQHDRVILTQEQRQQYLYGVMAEAGVELSTLEGRTARWLCEWADHTVSIIARWIQQAHEAGRPGPRTVTFDLGDDYDTRFVLTEALEAWKLAQLEKEQQEGGNEMRVRWASRADAMVAAIVAAAADGGAQS